MSRRGRPAAAGHVLATERLVLCPVTTDDHAALLALWTTPQVRRFLFDGAILSAAEITIAIQDSARDFAAGGCGLWLIRERNGTDLVGAAGLRPLENLGLEVYYSLAPGRRGNGFATEAARAVVEYGLGRSACPRSWPRSTRATPPRSRSSGGSA